jgi:hypothetical protein
VLLAMGGCPVATACVCLAVCNPAIFDTYVALLPLPISTCTWVQEAMLYGKLVCQTVMQLNPSS